MLKSVDALPRRFRVKIRVGEPVPGCEPCWIWTGATSPARSRIKLARPAPNPPEGQKPRGRKRTHDTVIAREKPMPLVQCTEVGYPVPAYRQIKALDMELPYKQLPRLERCLNPLCVQPAHTHVPLGAKLRPPMDPTPVTRQGQCEAELWKRLVGTRPRPTAPWESWMLIVGFPPDFPEPPGIRQRLAEYDAANPVDDEDEEIFELYDAINFAWDYR